MWSGLAELVAGNDRRGVHVFLVSSQRARGEANRPGNRRFLPDFRVGIVHSLDVPCPLAAPARQHGVRCDVATNGALAACS